MGHFYCCLFLPFLLQYCATGEYVPLLERHVQGTEEAVDDLETELITGLFRSADIDPRNGEIDAFELYTWVEARHFCDHGTCVDTREGPGDRFEGVLFVSYRTILCFVN
jgi:hypothetical protein